MQSLHYMEKWEKQSTNEDHFDNLRLVGFSPCGTLIAFGGESGLLLVTACDGVLKAVVRHASSSLVALEWCSPGLETVIGAFENGTIMSISLSEEELVANVSVTEGLSLNKVAVTQDGSRLASASSCNIWTWKQINEGEWKPCKFLSSPGNARNNARDDPPVVITSVHWEDALCGRLLVSYQFHGVVYGILQVLSNPSYSVVTSSQGYGMRIPRQSAALSCLKQSSGSLSPDRHYLAVVRPSTTNHKKSAIDVLNITKPQQNIVIETQRTLDGVVLFVHDGEAVLAEWDEGKVRLWQRVTGKRLQTLNHSGECA
ncbi:hypothetical protein PHLCEN_2v9500 [Hermanssonia centrifuga]|uniref:Uncharacterized protein n=1 Tax=Hermanssonia centrifuga TaxID=98765 RepID=A0A2R6NRE0_9APHY|nr:hypothetical protein PHLCEN_2v9500 [Hermanssonia centrifuga]